MPPLTDTKLRTLKPPPQRIELPDGQVRGLVLRVTPSGTKTWALAYRVRGQGEALESGKKAAGAKRRLTLGEYPPSGLLKPALQPRACSPEPGRGRTLPAPKRQR